LYGSDFIILFDAWRCGAMRRLRELRKKAGMNMRELGAVIGVTESAISYYERGKREPTFESVCKLARYFGVTVDYLMEADATLPAEQQADESRILYVYDHIDDEHRRELMRVAEEILNDYEA
jgi:transcriptional regulator with XRE-family HTH domain